MKYEIFLSCMNKLANVYGPKSFPKERVDLFWEKYERSDEGSFCAATNWLVLTMPPQNRLITDLDDFLSSKERSSIFIGTDEMDKLHPVPPNAKELAEKYAPSIMESMKGFGALPYDQNERIESDIEKTYEAAVEAIRVWEPTTQDWGMMSDRHEQHMIGVEEIKKSRRGGY